MQALDPRSRLPHQALEDGRVLTVDRDDSRSRSPGPLTHQRAGDDERLLVREGDLLTGRHGIEGREKTRKTDERRHHGVHDGQDGRLTHGLEPGLDADAGVL